MPRITEFVSRRGGNQTQKRKGKYLYETKPRMSAYGQKRTLRGISSSGQM